MPSRGAAAEVCRELPDRQPDAAHLRLADVCHGGSYPVFPTSDTTFYSPQDYLTVRVETNAAGGVAALVWEKTGSSG